MFLTWMIGCADPVTSKEVTEISGVCVEEGNFVVTFSTCLSSSCDSVESAECTTTVSGAVIEVSGSATIRSQGETCTSDCGYVTAECVVPDVDDPSATIVEFGGDQGGTLLSELGCAP